MLRRRLVLTAVLVLALVAAAGCTQSASEKTYSKLKGVWYQSVTGSKYDFASETQLVLPDVQANGGNTIDYKILDGTKIALTQNGVTQVSEIKTLDEQTLVTHNPATGEDRTFFRDLKNTDFAKAREKLIAGALAALKRFPTIDPVAKIVWTVTPPSGNIPAWPLWPTSSIARFKTAWSWTDFGRSSDEITSSGTGADAGYAITFTRSVPTTEQLDAYFAKSGKVVGPGGPLIDVGYSSTVATYPAGTFVYRNDSMIYSLGGGYAIGVKIGETAVQGFSPYTYRNQ
jgi:hypothetical protein